MRCAAAVRFAMLAALVACSARAPAAPVSAPVDAAPVVTATTATDAGPPVAPVATAPPVQAIAVGEHLSCALLVSGEVRCWGATRLDAMPVATTPVAVGIDDGVSLAVGARHVCVARVDGTVWCWGDNRDGVLGDGSSGRGAPTAVPGLTGIVEVVAGGFQTCARDGGGAVWCWGNPGTTGHRASVSSARPARVEGLTGATKLIVGDDVTCALVARGGPRCWGFNTAGLFGANPGPLLRAVPSKPLAKARLIGLGYRTACIVQPDGVTYCGGDDSFGELGDQWVPDDARCDPYARAGVTCTWTDPSPPPEAPAPGDPPRPDVWPPPARPPPAVHTKVFAPRSWFVYARLPGRAVALAGALSRTCAIDELGDVWCWGQMYNGANEWSHRTPRKIAGVQHAVAIAVAHEHACALDAEHVVRCWGYDRSGELGDGRATHDLIVSATATPVRW